MCLVTHITGWRRLIGSTKLQIIFHKRATEYRSLLRKMTYKDKGSYESSPPYNASFHTYECGISLIWMSHVIHMNEPCLIYEWGMSHVWLIGSRMDESSLTSKRGTRQRRTGCLRHYTTWMSHLPEILIGFRKRYLENFRFCWYSK